MGQLALALLLNILDMVKEEAVGHSLREGIAMDPGVEHEERFGERVFEEVTYLMNAGLQRLEPGHRIRYTRGRIEWLTRVYCDAIGRILNIIKRHT